MNKENRIYSILLFLIWPFLSLILAFRSYKYTWAKNIVWLYTIFYGLTFVFIDSMDAAHYKKVFMNAVHVDKTWANFIRLFDPTETNRLDFARDILNFLITVFTENYYIMFAVYGLIFGYFYSRNIWFVIEKVKGKLKPWQIPLLIFLAMYIGLWEINGFRFWTAAHIFIFGVINYLQNNRKKYLIIAFSSVLVHFSFILPCAILIGYKLIGNRSRTFFYFFLITLLFNFYDLDVLNSLAKRILPEIYHSEVDVYASENLQEVISERKESKSIVNIVLSNFYKYYNILCLILLYVYRRKYIISDKFMSKLLNFSLLFCAIINIFSIIPSVGRFLTISYFLFIMIFLLYTIYFKIGKYDKGFAHFFYISIFAFLFVRGGQILFSISYQAIIGNPLMTLFLNPENASIGDILKRLQ